MIDFVAIESTVRKDGQYCRGEIGNCGKCSKMKYVNPDPDDRAIYVASARDCTAIGDCLAVSDEYLIMLGIVGNTVDISTLIDRETAHCEEVEKELKDYLIEQLRDLKSGAIDVEEYFDDLALALAEVRINKNIAGGLI